MVRIQILKHNCSVQNMVELANNLEPTKCPFYMRMWNAYCFNFLGIRIILGEYR